MRSSSDSNEVRAHSQTVSEDDCQQHVSEHHVGLENCIHVSIGQRNLLRGFVTHYVSETKMEIWCSHGRRNPMDKRRDTQTLSTPRRNAKRFFFRPYPLLPGIAAVRPNPNHMRSIRRARSRGTSYNLMAAAPLLGGPYFCFFVGLI